MSGPEPFRLAMFPLGTVLFPGGALPLHVFEPRYRSMMDEAMKGDRRFGVVLISRGSEVGGGDQRVDVGTETRIDEAQQLADGRWVLVATGVQRVSVASWLPEDPYPAAMVRPLPTSDQPYPIDLAPRPLHRCEGRGVSSRSWARSERRTRSPRTPTRGASATRHRSARSIVSGSSRSPTTPSACRS